MEPKKLIVEVVEARDLLPKDGAGTCSPYVVVDFNGQRKRTTTVHRSLNPTWNEILEFDASNTFVADVSSEPLEVDVVHDRRVTPTRRNNCLGRLRLDSIQFVKIGDEALVHFPLQKKSFFSWVRGDIGLKIYYAEQLPPPPPPPPPPQLPSLLENNDDKSSEEVFVEATGEFQREEADAEVEGDLLVKPPPPPPPPEHIAESGSVVQCITVGAPQQITAEVTVVEPSNKLDLVEKMQYLFVRVVRGRYLRRGGTPHVRLSLSGLNAATHVATESSMLFEWDETFAFPRIVDSGSESLEIAVWDEQFVGGICFDTSEIPIRDPPDSPLAAQWYRLDGGDGDKDGQKGELMVSTWVGTQADESYHTSSKVEQNSHRLNRDSKIYISPKLWYLRLTVIGAVDLPAINRDSYVSIKAVSGFQAIRTRYTSYRNGSPAWGEDLLIVVAEPFGEQRLTLILETLQSTTSLASTTITLSSVERRVDDRQVKSRWLELESNDGGEGGRVQVRVCLDGGYHVSDEEPDAISDRRPSARQLWKKPIGIVEVGIIGCKGLLPTNSKTSPDAYVVAKYGSKWCRTRTVSDSLDPIINEQYSWTVYDISTFLTVAVFDDDIPSRPVGRIRILLSTLESGKAYRTLHPLLLLVPTGVKRMGEVEISIRFSPSVSSIDLIQTYAQPMMPPMHHLHPIPTYHRALLVSAAAKLVATHLLRSDPPLRREVVTYLLRSTSHRYSMRKVRTSWKRVLNCITWLLDGFRWLDETRSWKNPTTTLLAHGVFLLLVFYPTLIVPALTLHITAVGVLKYRKRRPPWESTAEIDGGLVGEEEIDEELDPIPTSKGYDVVKSRYDRLRVVVGKVQSGVADVAANGERVQALVTWQDPRATGVFVLVCFAMSIFLFVVPVRVVTIGVGLYFLRHPVFRTNTPPAAVNFFQRLPSLSNRFF